MIDQFNACCRNDRTYFVRIAARIVGREHAEDMVQESYVNAFRYLHCFRGQSSMKTWVTRIVVNVCLCFIRKAKRNPVCVDIEPFIAMIPETAVAEKGNDRNSLRLERVSSAMRVLNPRERVVIEMFLNTGKVGKENKTLKFRAVAKLRTVLIGRKKTGAEK